MTLTSLTVTAAGLVIGYRSDNINIGVWITIMLVVIIGPNSMPVCSYGETEFWFAETNPSS
jgi:amino acid transporter